MDSRAWILCTKWSGEEAYKLAQRAVNLLNYFDYDIELNKINNSGFGFAKLMSDGSLHYEVGIKEIAENPNLRFSVHEALAPTVACFHEVCGHGGQWRNEAKKDAPLSRVLLLNDLACKSSFQYYGVSPYYDEPEKQYFEQPHEIAAQYMGLKMTQKFLTAVYDEQTADKLLCEYVNLRIASGNTFIPAPDEPFTSMSQVYDQFQETFVKQVFTSVDYTVTKDSMDFVGDYINSQKWPWERIWSRKQVNQISDRLTQAYVLSAVWLDQYEYGSWIKDLPVFEHMDFPENITELIQNAPDHPDEADLDLKLLTEDVIDFVHAVEQIKSDTGQTL